MTETIFLYYHNPGDVLDESLGTKPLGKSMFVDFSFTSTADCASQATDFRPHLKATPCGVLIPS